MNHVTGGVILLKKIERTALAPTAAVVAEEQSARSSALAKRQMRRYRPNAENDARQTGGKTASSQVAPARFVTSRQSSYLRTNVAYTASTTMATSMKTPNRLRRKTGTSYIRRRSPRRMTANSS